MAMDLKLNATGAILSLVCVYTTFLIQLYIISIIIHLSQQEREKKLCKQQIRRVWSSYYYNNQYNKFKTLYKWCLFTTAFVYTKFLLSALHSFHQHWRFPAREKCKQQIRRVWNLFVTTTHAIKLKTLYEWRLLISSLLLH
jgi:hypothetical protein